MPPLALLRSLFRSPASLVIENLALRQQLAVLKRRVPRPNVRTRDRVFWALLRRYWSGWHDARIFVRPDTVVRWHRAGFRLVWKWKSPSKPGRPPLSREVIDLIRRMSTENRTWGAPRIRDELRLLGHEVAVSTVAKYMAPRPPSQRWRTFLHNHSRDIAACDFFVVPSVTFRLLFCFGILSHDRRKIVHVAVTEKPTELWAAAHVEAAFTDEASRPRFLIRDRDSIYGPNFQRRVKALGIDPLKTAYRAPLQNSSCERVIGTIRRDGTDPMIALSAQHLEAVLREDAGYDNESRTHRVLEGNSPTPRWVQRPEDGPVQSAPFLGGPHHAYSRVA